MIPLLWSACVIIFCFWKLMTVIMNPYLEWDVSPLALLFLSSISVRRRWLT